MRMLRNLFLALLALSLSPGDGNALALSPSLILLRDVPLGGSGSRQDVTKVSYQFSNTSDEDAVYSVKVAIPGAYTFDDFEKGYEGAPDASWFRLDREVVPVPAHGRAQVDLTIDIPDRPELRNRHWIVYVDAGQAQATGLGLSLCLRARIMLETMASTTVSEADARAGQIALSPSLVVMQPHANGTWSGEVSLRNNSTQVAQFTMLAVHEVYSGRMLDAASRYFSHVDQAVLGERWAQPSFSVLSLAAGEARTVRFTAPKQPSLVAGALREEVLFVARRTRGEPNPKRSFTVADQVYERMEVLRLRYQVPSESSAAP